LGTTDALCPIFCSSFFFTGFLMDAVDLEVALIAGLATIFFGSRERPRASVLGFSLTFDDSVTLEGDFVAGLGLFFEVNPNLCLNDAFTFVAFFGVELALVLLLIDKRRDTMTK
jgi:hypothetical protein